MAVELQTKGDETSARTQIKRLKYCVGGQWRETASGKYMPVFNPSTGEQIAEAPCCTVGGSQRGGGRGEARLPGLGEHAHSRSASR